MLPKAVEIRGLENYSLAFCNHLHAHPPEVGFLLLPGIKQIVGKHSKNGILGLEKKLFLIAFNNYNPREPFLFQ
jgi:hypothetical protein